MTPKNHSRLVYIEAKANIEKLEHLIELLRQQYKASAEAKDKPFKSDESSPIAITSAIVANKSTDSRENINRNEVISTKTKQSGSFNKHNADVFQVKEVKPERETKSIVTAISVNPVFKFEETATKPSIAPTKIPEEILKEQQAIQAKKTRKELTEDFSEPDSSEEEFYEGEFSQEETEQEETAQREIENEINIAKSSAINVDTPLADLTSLQNFSLPSDSKFSQNPNAIFQKREYMAYPSLLSTFGVRKGRATGSAVAKALEKIAETHGHDVALEIANRYCKWAKYHNKHFNMKDIQAFMNDIAIAAPKKKL